MEVLFYISVMWVMQQTCDRKGKQQMYKYQNILGYKIVKKKA